MNRRKFIGATVGGLATLGLPAKPAAAPPTSVFLQRGYYLCFMRLPTLGLEVWREILEGVAKDGANVIILWMAGAFRSRRFPITWGWAKDHENVKTDFARDLITHAHRCGLQVLLGFTPFGYDGVNQLPLVWRELTADPDLPDSVLRSRLGRELFGPGWQPQHVDDLLELFRVFNTDRDWSVPGALTTPALVRARAERGDLDKNKRALLRAQLAQVRAIASRHRAAAGGGAHELHRIAQWLANQWTPANASLLDPP